jgi:light-regulated signal transduction histidine kinase (bacteriophytochrome)
MAAPTFKRAARARRFCLRRENNTVFMTRITQTQQHNTTLFDDGWVYIHTKERAGERLSEDKKGQLE